MNIFHRFVSLKSNSGDSTMVSKNAWNDAMDIDRSCPSDSIVNTGCCAISVADYEIVTDTVLELAPDSVMEIL